ncbi:histidine kinase [Novosphingobium bradum]|uniref:Histidine kinase n=1 Tax=Novosphingobium bradum TaxID=1737444 RepID=A0ABV7IME4_9SPHN
MHKGMALAVAAGALMTATAGQAQSWGVWLGSGPGGGDWAMRSVCSGERARGLEGRLRHEQREGEIDPDTAERIHDAIDRLEDRSRDECDEGDRRAIWSIAQRFDRIQGWMDGAAHGGWRRGW